MVGDFNINYCNPNHPLMPKLNMIISSFFLHQVVPSHTHFSHSGVPSLIDLAFLSNPASLISCNVIPPLANSDHMGVSITYNISSHHKRPRSPRRSVWCYLQGDFERACDLLYEIDWGNVIDGNASIDENWESWQSTFLEVMSECIPQKTLGSRKHLPWITSDHLRLFKRRNNLLRKFNRTNRQDVFLSYKHTRNCIVRELRKAKRSFFSRMSSDPKAFWKLYKIVTKRESSIPTISDPISGDEISSSHVKANILNQQFSKNFNYSLSHSTVDPFSVPSEIPDDFLCTEDKVFEYLCSLDTKKSSGSDNISALMLKRCAVVIAPSIARLFNKSISTGTFPSAWKFARIVPIPKGGNRKSPANYRPVSILPVLSKLLEKHVSGLLQNYLNTCVPLSASQWGFTAGKSTTTALISFTHDIMEAVDIGHEVCSVFFDLSKAFDKVLHQVLIQKLCDLSVSPVLIRWIQGYLSNRYQAVVLDGAQSSTLPVVSGVPQGSVLGPLLFLIYIDEVSSSVNNGSRFAMYADDIALYRSVKTCVDYTLIQQDILSVCNWISDNYLVLNSSKCCYVIFSKKQSVSVPSGPLHVGNNVLLERKEQIKYLGVTFTSDLSWSKHIETIAKNARRQLGIMYRNFYSFTDSSCLLRLYKTTIRPLMEYASAVWDPHLDKNINALENVQKFALRICLKSWRESYSSMLDKSGLPTLSQRRQQHRLILLFKMMSKLVEYPTVPDQRVIIYEHRHPNNAQLTVPFANKNFFKNSFFPRTTSEWNSLCFDVSTVTTLAEFKALCS